MVSWEPMNLSAQHILPMGASAGECENSLMQDKCLCFLFLCRVKAIFSDSHREQGVPVTQICQETKLSPPPSLLHNATLPSSGKQRHSTSLVQGSCVEGSGTSPFLKGRKEGGWRGPISYVRVDAQRQVGGLTLL